MLGGGKMLAVQSPLLLFVVILAVTLLFGACLTHAQDCRDGYLFPAPTTPQEFDRLIVQSNEVFFVRFHNHSDVESLSMLALFEKFARVYKDKIRLVSYNVSDPAQSTFVHAILRHTGVYAEGLPNLRMYYERQKESETATTAKRAKGAAAKGAAAKADGDESGKDSSSSVKGGEKVSASCADGDEVCVEGDESADAQYNVILPKDSKKRKPTAAGTGEQKEAKKPKKADTPAPSSGSEGAAVVVVEVPHVTEPLSLLRGKGAAFQEVKRKILSALRNLETNSNGYYLKRVV